MLSRQIFTNCINAIKCTTDFQSGLAGLVDNANQNYPHMYCDLGSVIYPDCAGVLFELLEEVMNDNDGMLEYFCYELEFGSKYEPGDVKDESGNEVKLATIDDLYDYLSSAASNGNN